LALLCGNKCSPQPLATSSTSDPEKVLKINTLLLQGMKKSMAKSKKKS
jgi:hypothetical protein